MTATSTQPNRHPELVELAARRYLAQLASIESEVRPSGVLGTAVRHLTELQRAALEAEGPLPPQDVPNIREDLAKLSEWQVLAVLDHQVLGYGRDDARLLVMGTEEAIDPSNPGDLVWACTSEVIWKTGSDHAVLELLDKIHFAHTANLDLRPFHLQPNDLWQVQNRGRGTWRMLAQLLRPADAVALLRRPPAGQTQIGLGDLCYQVEVSAFPSKQALTGRSPAAARVDFLGDLVQTLSEAQVLLFHGGAWDDARSAIARHFLGSAPVLQEYPEPRRWLAWASAGGRSVIHTYALNGRIRNDYLDLVRGKLTELAPQVFESPQ